MLTARGVAPGSVFRLLGNNENSATFALGWALEKSSAFRSQFLTSIFARRFAVSETTITLQSHGPDGGFTDLELQEAGRFHVIVEAKVGWQTPTVKQLKRYRPRFGATTSAARLVTVSAMSTRQAGRRLPMTLSGVAVKHISWNEIHEMAARAHKLEGRFDARLWLTQLREHLQEFVTLDRLIDNRVYVVSLGAKPMIAGKKHTWIDVVEKDGHYFHPVGPGGGWPAQPPNYIGFRYNGRLQSVHHIEDFEVCENVADRNNLWVRTKEDHFVYRLGPPMRPASAVRTGNIYMNGRVWCAIDTLLSGGLKTVSAARDETKRRATRRS